MDKRLPAGAMKRGIVKFVADRLTVTSNDVMEHFLLKQPAAAIMLKELTDAGELERIRAPGSAAFLYSVPEKKAEPTVVHVDVSEPKPTNPLKEVEISAAAAPQMGRPIGGLEHAINALVDAIVAEVIDRVGSQLEARIASSFLDQATKRGTSSSALEH